MNTHKNKLDTQTLLCNNAITDNQLQSRLNLGRELQKLRKSIIKICLICGAQFTKLSIAKTCSNKCKCKLYRQNKEKL